MRSGRLTVVLRFGFLFALFASRVCGQAAVRACPGGPNISVDYDYIYPGYGGASGTRLIYGIRRLTAASSAWVEVWDGGLRLLHQQVPVRSIGDFKWTHLREVPHTPSSLSLSIFDPELRIFGDGPAALSKGGIDYRTMYWAGDSPDEEEPTFSLASDLSSRIQEGTQRADIKLDGIFEGTPTDIVLVQKGEHEHWLATDYLQPLVLDRRHIQVTLPERLLEKPVVLGLSNKLDGQEVEIGTEVKPPQQTIYIYSKDSPTLSEITPSEISASEASEGSFHIPIHLHGSGFTPASVVVQSLYDHDLVNLGQTRFISSNDLEFDLYKGDVIVGDQWSAARPIRLWVANGDWLHLSEPQEIRIVPSSLFPPDPYIAEASRITHVFPDPIGLIDPAGPAFLEVLVQGEHFRRGESAVAIVNLESHNKEIKLRTQFVSSTELRAWLPRDVWGKHHLKYSFSVITPGGVCSVELAEDDDN